MTPSEDLRPTFATLLQHYRQAAGLSQEELAERAGLSRRGISDIERGVRRSPYPATVRSLAEALHLDDADLTRLLRARGGDLELHGATAPASGRLAQGLPAELNTLIGREPDVRDVITQLERARLLTLTGVG